VCEDLVLSSDITQEILLWLEMCRERANEQSTRYSYWLSLSDEPPGAAYWPLELRKAFVGTNLQFLAEEDLNKCRYERILGTIRERLGEESFPRDVFSIDNLMWARGHCEYDLSVLFNTIVHTYSSLIYYPTRYFAKISGNFLI